MISKNNEGIKNDKGKPDLALLIDEFLEEMAKCGMAGEKKYDRWNWTLGLEWSRYEGGIGRHKSKWQQGESIDPEGFHHLAAVAFNAMMLWASEVYGIGEDTRWKRPNKTELKNKMRGLTLNNVVMAQEDWEAFENENERTSTHGLRRFRGCTPACTESKSTNTLESSLSGQEKLNRLLTSNASGLAKGQFDNSYAKIKGETNED